MNNEEKIIVMLEQQAVAQEQQAVAQEQQAKLWAEQMAYQAQINELVLHKLDLIQANVLEIKGKVITDFPFVLEAKDAKQELETAFNVIEWDDAAAAYHKHMMDTKNRTKEARAYRAAVRAFSTGKVYREYDINATRGMLTSTGNWVGNITHKVFGEKFGGLFPPQMHDAVSRLVGYSALYRDSSVRMY